MLSIKKVSLAALAVATIAGSTLSMTSTADARGWGHRGGWGGPAVVGGLALGALAAGSAYGYGYGYGPGYGAYAYDDGYGGCELRRRVRYTPYGPVVRHVRVCY